MRTKVLKNEADVKEEVKKVLDALGIYWYMPVQTGYGARGIPDFIACYAGRFLAIETKYGKNDLSAWQEKQREKITEANGIHFVINEENVFKLSTVLLAIESLYE